MHLTVKTLLLLLILAFACIHLGVSIAIIVRNRSLSSIYRPEIGLASYNVFISGLGFLVSAVGLLFSSHQKSMIRYVIALLLAILFVCSLGSLITALVINSKSSNYIRTRLLNKMMQYSTNNDSMVTIDCIQDKFECCGHSSWLDWYLIEPNDDSSTTSAPLTTSTIDQTTTTTNAPLTTSTIGQTTTTSALETESPSTVVLTSTTVETSSSTTEADFTTNPPLVEIVDTNNKNRLAFERVKNRFSILFGNTASEAESSRARHDEQQLPKLKRNVNRIKPANDYLTKSRNQLTKRSITEKSNGKPPVKQRLLQEKISISLSSDNLIPASCYCKSPDDCGFQTNTYDVFHSRGCFRYLITRANQQDMGIGIINCFLIALSFVAALLFLMNTKTSSNSTKVSEERKHQVSEMPQRNRNLGPNTIITRH